MYRLLRKLYLKFLEDIKMKKIHLSAACTNLTEIWLWDIWSIHILILQSSLKSVEQSANFEKYTFEKNSFYVFGEYREGKNSYLSTAYTNLAVRRLKYTCTNPAKFIEICGRVWYSPHQFGGHRISKAFFYVNFWPNSIQFWGHWRLFYVRPPKLIIKIP